MEAEPEVRGAGSASGYHEGVGCCRIVHGDRGMINTTAIDEVTWHGVLPITNGGVGVAAPLRLYLLTIPDPTEVSYLSVYDSCLVAAYSGDEARHIHPMNKEGCDDMWDKPAPWGDYYWVPLDKVELIEVTEVGTANGDIVPGVVRTSLRHA